MRGILADINVGKQRDALLSIRTSDRCREIWNGLGLVVGSFPTLGLSYDASDALIWTTCQREQLVLITGTQTTTNQVPLGTRLARGTIESLFHDLESAQKSAPSKNSLAWPKSFSDMR